MQSFVILKAGSIKLKKIVKSNNQVEESNMSSVMDDDDSSMMINSSSKLKLKRNQTDVEDNNEDGEATNMNPTNFDEISNDNSNFASSKATVKRTGFKNLFVEQVIGKFLFLILKILISRKRSYNR
jgi:hypothetical protein